MAPKLSLFALIAVSVTTSGLQAAAPENTEQEYQQVRKIALRDSKVRGAYEEADRKLEEKILQIDPALADYLHRRSTAPTTAAEPKKGGFHANPTPAPANSKAGTYVVKTGDTLGAIASQYHVSVAALKSANHIVDEKKLAVGQTLNIPAR